MNRCEMEAGSSDPANVMRDLRAELMAVEPSPAFAAGVRARVEQQQAGTSPYLRWALAAAAVVAVATGGYWLVPREDAPAMAVRAAVPPPVVVAEPPAEAPRAPRPVAEPVRRNAVVRHVAGEPGAVAASGPDLTVITDQPDAIRRLWLRSGQNALRSGLPPSEMTEITVPPVVVSPIVIPLLGDAGRGGVAPEVRRLTGENGAVNTDSAPRSER